MGRMSELEKLQLLDSPNALLQNVIRAAMSYVESVYDGNKEYAEYWEESLAFWCREVALEKRRLSS